MPRKLKTETLAQRASQARAESYRYEVDAALAERQARESAATLAAMRYAETPLHYKRAEVVADGYAIQARHYRKRATLAKRRADRADRALADRREEERAAAAELAREREEEERRRIDERDHARPVSAMRARSILAGIAPIPDDDHEREALADAVESLLADGASMLGHGETNAARQLLAILGRNLGDD